MSASETSEEPDIAQRFAAAGVVAAAFAQFGKDALKRGRMLTNPFNVTGSPPLASPIGFGADGLPLGAQLVGRPFDEATVLRIGAAFERAAGVIARRPPCFSATSGVEA